MGDAEALMFIMMERDLLNRKKKKKVAERQFLVDYENEYLSLYGHGVIDNKQDNIAKI